MTLIVNGQKVDDSLVQREAERLRPQYEQVFAEMDAAEREDQLLEWSKENVIERLLLEQEAKSRNCSVTQAEIESAFEDLKAQYAEQAREPEKPDAEAEKRIKDDIALQIKVERLLKDITKDLPEPSDEELSKFYEQNKQHFTTPEQVRVAHIVKHIDGRTDEREALETMKKVLRQLKAGALFEMLVSGYSDCPDNGGDLGCFARGQMAEEFEDVVFNLAVGQTSDIFRTRFGFHIAKLYERKPPVLTDLAEVRKNIARQLKEKMRSDAIDTFVDRLKSTAEIKEA